MAKVLRNGLLALLIVGAVAIMVISNEKPSEAPLGAPPATEQPVG